MTLKRRDLLQQALGLSFAALVAPRVFAQDSASAFYQDCIAIDGLGGPDLAEGALLSPQEIEHIANSGLTAVHMTLGTVGTAAPLAAFEAIVRDIAKWEHQISANPGVLAQIRRAPDIRTAKNAGKTGLIYGLQDGVSFEDDLGRLSALHHVGIRVIQPTYNRRNLLGDGCMEPSDAGLSRVGFEAVERMNELGITVDLSHCGRRTTADAISASKRPVSFTHTGCHALVDHPRHRTDQEMKAVAESGGVTGIFIMPYLARGEQPTAQDVILHLEHAIKVAGEDHVSIGTDGNLSPTTLTQEYIDKFREGTRKRAQLGIAAPYETETGYLFANDLNTARRFETLAGMLLDRGHSEARVEKILGANLLRVFEDTWSFEP